MVGGPTGKRSVRAAVCKSGSGQQSARAAASSGLRMTEASSLQKQHDTSGKICIHREVGLRDRGGRQRSAIAAANSGS